MTKYERMLVPGSTEMPDCQCGLEMQLARSTQFDKSPDAEVRIYKCSECGHELRLTVWADAITPVASDSSL
jgi:hypothetical protein